MWPFGRKRLKHFDCTHCGAIAGFWVTAAKSSSRYPWCLACIDGERLRFRKGLTIERFEP